MSGDVDYEKGDAEKHLLLLCSVCAFCGDSFCRHALPRDAFCGDLQMLRARTGYDRIVLWPRRIIVRLLPLRWCILRRGRCLGTAA